MFGVASWEAVSFCRRAVVAKVLVQLADREAPDKACLLASLNTDLEAAIAVIWQSST